MIRQLPKKYLKKEIEFLNKHHTPYVLEVQNKSYTLHADGMSERYSDNFLKPEGLALLKQVTKHVEENKIPQRYEKKTAEQLGIKYICFNKKFLNRKMTGIVEIDADAAYWTAAHQLGIINQEIFDRGIVLGTEENDKLARLVALGILARKRIQRKFDGYKYGRTKTIISSAQTRHLWDLISSRVDKVMQAAMKATKGGFSFYWIDAIFVVTDKRELEKVKAVLAKNGFGCKTVENAWYEFRKDAAFAFSAEKGRKMKDVVAKTLDLNWIKKNVDLGRLYDLRKKHVVRKNIQDRLDNTKKSLKHARKRDVLMAGDGQKKQLEIERLEALVAELIEQSKRVPQSPSWNADGLVEVAKRKVPDIKQNLKNAGLHKMNAKRLRISLQHNVSVRNFCYSITNKDIWLKPKKKKVGNKK